MQRYGIIGVAVAAVLLAAVAKGEQDEKIEAPIKRVTVYPDQAQVTRVGSLQLAAGDHTVVFENLPAGVIDASFEVAASGASGITLLSLTHTTKEHLEAPTQKVAQLERELDSLVKNRKQVVSDRLVGLKQLQEFVAALKKGASDEAAGQVVKGGINVAQWSAAFDFTRDKTFALGDSIRQANQELADIESRVQLVQHELRNLSTVNQRTTRTVSVGLSLERAGEVELTLEYLVPGANWTPLYDARIEEESDTVDFTYQAEVSQRTGEDWPDAELTLSTAQVSFGAGPGRLEPWFLAETLMPVVRSSGGPTGQIVGRLTDRSTGEPIIGASVLVAGTTQGAMTDLSGNFQILRVDPGSYTLRISHLDFATTEVTDVAVRTGKTSLLGQSMMAKVSDLDQTITVVGTRDILDKFVVDGRVTMSQEGIRQRPVQTVDNLLEQVAGVQTNADREMLMRGGRGSEAAYIVPGTISGTGAYPVTFHVKGTESITSGGEAVRVTVARWNLAGQTKLVARPRNRDGAFRLVTLKNQDKAPLLAGRVAIFVGTHFLGYARLDHMISPREELELPFGVDNFVTVVREVVDFMKKTRGNRTETEQTIQISLVNHGPVARQVELEESLPISRDNRIKVELGKIIPEPMPEGDVGAPKWSLRIEPGEEVKIEIPYKLSYPSSMRVVGL
jgi:hypothetical protein